MKFIITTKELRQGLSQVLPIIPPKSTLQCLECVLIQLSTAGVLTFQGANTELSIKAIVNIPPEDISEGNEDGILVKALKLKGLIEELPECKLEITSTDNTILIKSDTGKYKLQVWQAEETISDLFDNLTTGVLSEDIPVSEELREAIEKPTFCVSKDEFRLAMTGVSLTFKDDIIEGVATDSFRLFRVTAPKPANAPQDLKIILPVAVAKLIGSARLYNLMIQVVSQDDRPKYIRIHNDEIDAVARLIGEKYPPYESVIPQNNDRTVTVNLSDLKSLLKRVSIFANKTSLHVALNITADGLAIESEDTTTNSAAREVLPCSLNFTLDDDESIRIGFNILYLRAMLDNLLCFHLPDVTLAISENTKPVILNTEEGQDRITALVMPVRLVG